MQDNRTDQTAPDKLLAGDLCFDIANFARQLAEIPSPPSRERAAAEFVVGRMQLLGYDRAFLDAAGNAVGVVYGRDTSAAILLASPLTAGPRRPTENNPNDRLLHLDRSDAKGGLAAQVYAGACLKRNGSPLDRSVVVCGGVSDSGGWGLGITHLLAQTLPDHGIKPVFAIGGHPTNLNLSLGRDGWVGIEIRLDGTHSLRLQDAVQKVVRAFDRDYPHPTYTREGQFVQIDEPEFLSFDGFTRARLILTRRLPIGSDPDRVAVDLEKQVQRLVEPYSDVWAEAEIPVVEHHLPDNRTLSAPDLARPWMIDSRRPFLGRIVRELRDRGCRFRRTKGRLPRLRRTTVGTVTAGEFGLPTIGYGPGNGGLVTPESLNEAVLGTVLMTSIISNEIPTERTQRRREPASPGAGRYYR